MPCSSLSQSDPMDANWAKRPLKVIHRTLDCTVWNLPCWILRFPQAYRELPTWQEDLSTALYLASNVGFTMGRLRHQSTALVKEEGPTSPRGPFANSVLPQTPFTEDLFWKSDRKAGFAFFCRARGSGRRNSL